MSYIQVPSEKLSLNTLTYCTVCNGNTCQHDVFKKNWHWNLLNLANTARHISVIPCANHRLFILLLGTLCVWNDNDCCMLLATEAPYDTAYIAYSEDEVRAEIVVFPLDFLTHQKSIGM